MTEDIVCPGYSPNEIAKADKRGRGILAVFLHYVTKNDTIKLSIHGQGGRNWLKPGEVMNNLYEKFDKNQAKEIAFGVYFSRNHFLDFGVCLCFFVFLPAAKQKYSAGAQGLCQ